MDFDRAYKYDQENTQKYVDQKINIFLNVFPQQNRLCSQFSNVKVVIGNATAIVTMHT